MNDETNEHILVVRPRILAHGGGCGGGSLISTRIHGQRGCPHKRILPLELNPFSQIPL